MMNKLWGDNFYNPEQRRWSKKPGVGFIRGFNKFVLAPIYKVRRLSIFLLLTTLIQTKVSLYGVSLFMTGLRKMYYLDL